MDKPVAQQSLQILFFSTMICAFLPLVFVMFGARFFNLDTAVAWIIVPPLTALLGYPVISRYRIQYSSPFRRTVFIAAFLGAFFAFFGGLEQIRHSFPEEGIESITGTLVISIFVGCCYGFAVFLYMKQRAIYLLSGITNDWLRSYATKTRVIDQSDTQTDLPLKITETLQRLQPSQKRFPFSFYTPILFLDSVPDGEHCLCLQKKVFYCIPRYSDFYRIDRDQVEEIQERFGEFRKTRFISQLSSKGDYIRDEARLKW